MALLSRQFAAMLVRRCDGSGATREVVIAARALQQDGLDSPSIALLARLPDSERELNPLQVDAQLRRALRALSGAEPSAAGWSRAYALELGLGIVARRSDAVQSCHELAALARSAPLASLLAPWPKLAEPLLDGRLSPTQEQALRAEAERLMGALGKVEVLLGEKPLP